MENAKVTLGKSASVTTTVNENNAAISVGSGSLAVFATPMMIALMEHAACEALGGQVYETSELLICAKYLSLHSV